MITQMQAEDKQRDAHIAQLETKNHNTDAKDIKTQGG